MSRAGKRILLQAVGTNAIGNWSTTYRWIPILGAVVAFAMAVATGANDTPVSFSTCIGSGALTVLQASAAAWVMEFPGAAFASNRTVDLYHFDILRERQPNEALLMWSLLVVLMTATIWLGIGTYLELPVSSLLSIQGALLGTSLASGGVDSVLILDKDSHSILPERGILTIPLALTVAPLIAAIMAFIFFGSMKISLLRAENAERRTLRALPFYYGASVVILCLFISNQIQVLPKVRNIGENEIVLACVASLMAGFIAAVLSLIIVVPLARKRLARFNINSKRDKASSEATGSSFECRKPQRPPSPAQEEDDIDDFPLKEFMEMRALHTVYEADEEELVLQSPDHVSSDCNPSLPADITMKARTSPEMSFKELLAHTPNRLTERRFERRRTLTPKEKIMNYVNKFKEATFQPNIEYDRQTLIRHALAEKFDESVEELFSFPQIISACAAALAHGANDVAAAMGPYAAILEIYRQRKLFSGEGNIERYIHAGFWIQAMGGVGACIGLLLCGWRLSRCLGGRLTYLTHSRGFSAQICGVATIFIASKLKLPVSSTHIFIGSILGVGAADNIKNVNWKLFLMFVGAWIGSVVGCCGIASAFFSFTVYSPSYTVP